MYVCMYVCILKIKFNCSIFLPLHWVAIKAYMSQKKLWNLRWQPV